MYRQMPLHQSLVFARFRYGPSGLASTGSATYGEVEDYMVKIICALVAQPKVSVITQPSCDVPSGSVVLEGLPAAGIWTLTRMPGTVITTGTGTSTTISGLEPGTWTYTVTNESGCSSAPSENITILPIPAGPGSACNRCCNPANLHGCDREHYTFQDCPEMVHGY